MSQGGQGYGGGEQTAPPSWRPQEADAWSPPVEPQGAPWARQPPAGYPHPGYVPPGLGPTPRTPAVAIVGFVLAFVLAPVGLVVSLVALGPTKRVGAGRGLAVAGSIVGGFLTVIGIVVAVSLVSAVERLAGPSTSVLRFDAAVENASCDEFMATSTRAFRTHNVLATCDDFSAFVASDGYQDNRVQVLGVAVENGVATVRTTETYLWLDDGQTYTDRFEYRVVREDGAWRVDGIDLASR